MNLQKFFKIVATLGPLGYFFASGTFGSMFGLILVFFIYRLIINPLWQIIFFLICFVAVYMILNNILESFNKNDPREIIIDEVLGCFAAFLGLDLNIKNLILGFLLFRLLDITKILGIVYLEFFLKEPFSILIDDVFAGLLTNLFLRLFNAVNV